MFTGNSIITILVIGGLAGWLAGLITQGGGFGIITNIIIGIVGAFLGKWVFGLIGYGYSGFWGQLIVATIGAVILVILSGLIKRPKRS